VNLTPLPAGQALDAYFLEARSKLLDLAAILDRIDRGRAADEAARDPRVQKVRQALEMLLGREAGRAARVQQVFSLPYDPDWKRPQPR
jgi:hypothetical protein